MKHLAVFKSDTAEEILSGKKNIDIRLSKTKVPPFGVISADDIVYIKIAGKDIIGQFRVKKVITYDGVTSDDLEDIKKRYKDTTVQIYGNIESEKEIKYATIIFIAASNRFITSPIKVTRKNLRNWRVLD